MKKRLVFVIDWSRSMRCYLNNIKTSFDVAVENAVKIVDSYVCNDDDFEIVFFDHKLNVSIPLQKVKRDNHDSLRNQLKSHKICGGSTLLCRALNSTTKMLETNNLERRLSS